MFVWTQLVTISTCAMIWAICVNAMMFTATIARLTLIDIWKDKMRQDKINLITNQSLTCWMMLLNTRKHLNFLCSELWSLTQSSLNIFLIFNISGYGLVPIKQQSVIWNKEVWVFCSTRPQWVNVNLCSKWTIWYITRWVVPIMVTRATCLIFT